MSVSRSGVRDVLWRTPCRDLLTWPGNTSEMKRWMKLKYYNLFQSFDHMNVVFTVKKLQTD